LSGGGDRKLAKFRNIHSQNFENQKTLQGFGKIGLQQAGNLEGLNINDFIGQLYGRDNIQHICGFNDLLVFNTVEVSQAGSTNQNLKSIVLKTTTIVRSSERGDCRKANIRVIFKSKKQNLTLISSYHTNDRTGSVYNDILRGRSH
jgi:hypothetical protein